MDASTDVICFSHLRWGFVYQRPNHLMQRMAARRRVFFVEEPVFDAGAPRLEERVVRQGLVVVTPHLEPGLSPDAAAGIQRTLIRELVARHAVRAPLLWFYTPMALPLAEGLAARAVVYDCMDDLTGFVGAPPELGAREEQLHALADVSFTGGHSLCEAKRARGVAAHAFPSSVDVAHFAQARKKLDDPSDQADIPRPRVGWFGVIDERLDVALLDRLAVERPSYQFVMIGPVVKIDPASLPRRPNLHWLGSKDYGELPHYIAGWDAAIMPFALNRATRFISPTKTLEYLAAGVPVVSTAIHDVVHPYGVNGNVVLADAESFPMAVDAALRGDRATFLKRAEAVLASTSWDATFASMMRVVDAATRSGRQKQPVTVEGGAAACSTI